MLVRVPADLEGIEGLIIPGGESTTIGKLLILSGLQEAVRGRIRDGMPVYGTCAGMILLAKDIGGLDQPLLGVMDIKVAGMPSAGRGKASRIASPSPRWGTARSAAYSSGLR